MRLYNITLKINEFFYKLRAKFWIRFINVTEIKYNPTNLNAIQPN